MSTRLAVMLAGMILLACPAQSQAAGKLNIVLIIIDDMGWKDLGCYGNGWVETPSIDRLAGEGVRFTDFYANCPVCSPTRAAIQSGQYQTRFALTAHIPGHYRPFEKLTEPENAMFMPGEIVTVGESLRTAGYKTGYFGKWHLGSEPKHLPRGQGYDEGYSTGGSHFAPGFRTNPKTDIPEGAYLTEFLTGQAVDFIKQHKDEPFFLTVAHYAVHIPLQARREKIAKYEQKPRPAGVIMHPVYAAMIEHVDDSVGHILTALEDEGLAEDTVVVFTSDNGGLNTRYDGQGHVVTTNLPLRDEKGAPYEGGIRIPTIIRWPGVAKPGGECDAPALSVDFYPTLLEAAEAEAPGGQTLDGVSLVPVLKNPKGELGPRALFWHYPHYHHSRPASAVREGNFKLLHFYDDDSMELYDLGADLGEMVNLAASQPEKVKELRGRLDSWRAETGALSPAPNERFDPARAGEWWRKGEDGEAIDLEATREGIRSLPFDGPANRAGGGGKRKK